jgi:hypothetical protein
MDRLTLTHESRCLIILAGGVLERCIENRARTIAASRSADAVAAEDIDKATREFLREELADLPQLIGEATDEYRRRSSDAA